MARWEVWAIGRDTKPRDFASSPFFKAATQNNPAQLGSSMQEFALVDLHAKLDADPGNLGLLNSVSAFYNIKKEYRKSLSYSSKVLEKEPLNKQALKNI